MSSLREEQEYKIEEIAETSLNLANESEDGFVEPTEADVYALMWKLDVRPIPFLGPFYLCSFLDRVNIGNAKLAGLTKFITISDNDYNWALSILFIGYVRNASYSVFSIWQLLFETPSNLMLMKTGPSKWILIVMVTWSMVICAMAAVKMLLVFWWLDSFWV
ncbi:unnamed protein product [Umbelopsis ramanniana]